MILPGVFIPLAQELGILDALSGQLFGHACRDAITWPSDLSLSFNFSPSQLSDRRFADAILTVLHETGLPPHRLEVEITESALVEDLEATRHAIQTLRSSGVRVAIDDFGTGYSSLGQLTELPVDVLKIDRTFVNRMDTPGSRAIVTAVVTLGQALGLTITAEGVERADQAAQLSALGCDLLQGFHFGAGVSATQIAAMTFFGFGHGVSPG